MHDYFSVSDRLQGPNHMYYNDGKRLYTGFGTSSHTTELSLAVTPNISGSAVAILLNKTTRLAFDDDRPGNAALTEPMGNGYSSGGYYDQWSEPETLIEGTGSRSARMTFRSSKP